MSLALADLEREYAELAQEQADDLNWLSRVDASYPLGTSMLWTAPRALMDQRRSVVAALENRVTLVKGGWRSGKSEGQKQLTTAEALGSGHPAVRSWLKINRLPEDAIPEAPAQVYVIGQSSNDSLRYHRDDFDRLVGPSGVWTNRKGKGEALLEVPIPGSRAVAKIWFKSVDQKSRAFRGISIMRAFVDEEPVGPDGRDVYDELRARVADQSGRISIAFVPMDGLTWVYEKLERDGEDGAEVVEIDTLDNPYLPADFQELYGGMSLEDLDVRRYGRFRSRSGAVFPMWAAGDGFRWGPGHVCNDFEIPAEWPRFRGADFGLVNPTCVLRAALGDDDCLYVYREYWAPSSPAYEVDAQAVRDQDAKERFLMGWGDPAAKDAREKFNSKGVFLAAGTNDIKAGIDRIKARLRIQADNRPRLKVFKSCTNLIREMPALLWNTKLVDPLPIKKDDHAADALKYLCAGIQQWKGL